MLPNRLDTLEPAPVDRGGDACDEPAWMRRAGGEPQPDERAKPRRRAMQGVALGHQGPDYEWAGRCGKPPSTATTRLRTR